MLMPLPDPFLMLREFPIPNIGNDISLPSTRVITFPRAPYIYVGGVIINLQLFQHGHTRAGASETVVLGSPGGSKDATSDGGTLEPTLKQSPRLWSADCGRALQNST